MTVKVTLCPPEADLSLTMQMSRHTYHNNIRCKTPITPAQAATCQSKPQAFIYTDIQQDGSQGLLSA